MEIVLRAPDPAATYVRWGTLAAIDLHYRWFDADRAAAVAVEHFGGRPTLRVLPR